MNATNTHTPAPWSASGCVVRACPDDASLLTRERATVIAETPYTLEDGPEAYRAAAANARLIAAAPALLAALEFIVNDAPEGEDAQLTAEGYNRACEAIRLARGA